MWDDEVLEPGGEPGEEPYEPKNNRIAALREWWAMKMCSMALENTTEEGFDCCEPNQVLRGRLWIGDFIGAEKLGSYPLIKAIVSLHKNPDHPYTYPLGLEYDRHHIAVEDSSSDDILQHLTAATDFIHAHIQKGNGVYVHCQAGVSRSATVCIAYLIRFGGMTLDQAYMTVYCVRPIICPNLAFIRQLLMFEKELIQINL